MEYLVIGRGNAPGGSGCVIEDYGVPSLVLMERAALPAVELMEGKVLIFPHRCLSYAEAGITAVTVLRWQGFWKLQRIVAEVWFVGNPEHHVSKEAAFRRKSAKIMV